MLGIIQTEPFILATLQKELSGELGANDPKSRQLVEEVKKKLNELVFKCRKQFPMDMMLVIENMIDAGEMAYLVAANLGLDVSQVQEMLEIGDPFQRLLRLKTILGDEIDLLLKGKVKKNMTSKIPIKGD